MSIRLKAVTAIVLLVLALAAGLYLAGWLTLLLLGLHQVKLDWRTYWQYWQRLDLPQVAPYVNRIKIAGGAGFGLPLLLWLGALVLLLMRGSREPALHGNARFATVADLKKSGLLGDSPTGIVVGKWGSQLIRLPGQQFVMLAAPTRSGKGVGIVIPNLLAYQESVVVLDIKQENFDLTSGWRKQQGQEIYLFNPFAEDKRTHRWNPLSYVSSDPAFRISDIQAIAAMLYPDDDSGDKFWLGQARNAFTAFALYLFERNEDFRRKGWPASKVETPTLGRLYRLSSGVGQDLKTHLRKLSEKPFLTSNTQTAFANLLSQAEETFASIMGMFQEPLNAWVNPVLDAATSANDFWLSDVRKKKMTIYIGIQPNKLAESRLIVNLFFSQFINVNTKELPQNNPELKYQCLLLMDEFTAIGRVDILAQAVAYIAGYNLRLLPIIQSMAQLDSVYGQDVARTLMTNHALQILYAPREQHDANEYSDMLGYTTVKQDRLTKGRDVTRSEHQERRALMLPQELKALGADKEVFLYEGLAHPVKCGKIRYYQDQRFTRRVLPKVPIAPLALGTADVAQQPVPALPPKSQRQAESLSERQTRPEPPPLERQQQAEPPSEGQTGQPQPSQPPLALAPWLGPGWPEPDPNRPGWYQSARARPEDKRMRVVWRPKQPQPKRYLPPFIRAPGAAPYQYPESKLERWERWRPPAPPPDAPPPDYGDFWQRYPPPPEGLVVPLSPEAPIEAMLHGPRIRVIMGRLAVDEYLEEEGAHLSGLVPVHRARYDHAYERDMLRQLKLANELTEKEYGPHPLYTPPPPPKRKPDLSFTRPALAERLWQAREQELAQADTPEQPARRDRVFAQQSDEQEIKDMNFKQAAAAAALTVAGVGAAAISSCIFAPGQNVRVSFNPHPRQRYELTLTIKDAPGPFDKVIGSVGYQVTNEKCSPENKFEGVWTPPQSDQPVEFKRIDDNTYVGEIYLDLLKDEDYYGLGVCHWQLVSVGTVLVGNRINFAAASLDLNRIVKQESQTADLFKSDYYDESLKGTTTNAAWANTVKEHPEKLFPVTLTAKENFK